MANFGVFAPILVNEKVGDPTGGLMEKYTSKVPNFGFFAPFWSRRRWETQPVVLRSSRWGLGGKHTSKVPDFGAFDPILVHEKMGEDGRPNLWFFGGK